MSGFFGYFSGGSGQETEVVREDTEEVLQLRQLLSERMDDTIAPSAVAYQKISEEGGKMLQTLKEDKTFAAVKETVDIICWDSFSMVAEAHPLRVGEAGYEGESMGVEWCVSTNHGTELAYRSGQEATDVRDIPISTLGKRNEELASRVSLPNGIGEFLLLVQKHHYSHKAAEKEGEAPMKEIAQGGDYDEVVYLEEFMLTGLPHLVHMKEHVHRLLSLLYEGGGFDEGRVATEELRDAYRKSFPAISQWVGNLMLYEDIELLQDLKTADDGEEKIRVLHSRMPLNVQFLKQNLARVSAVLSGVTDLTVKIMDLDGKKQMGSYRVADMVAYFDAVLYDRKVVWTDVETGDVLRNEDGSLDTVDWNCDEESFEVLVVVTTSLKMFWMSPTIVFPETKWKMKFEMLRDLSKVHEGMADDFCSFIVPSGFKELVRDAKNEDGSQRFPEVAQLTIDVVHIGSIPGDWLVSWLLPVDKFKAKILESLRMRVCSLPLDDIDKETSCDSVANHPVANMWTTLYVEIPKLPSVVAGVMKIFASTQWIQNVLSIGCNLCDAIVTDFKAAAERLMAKEAAN